jgi:hypothetical protein
MSTNKAEDTKAKVEKKNEEKPLAEEKKEEQKPEQKQLEIEIDGETAFTLKLQEFDKNIALAECQVADLKRQKIEFAYNRNVQMIADNYKQQQLKKRIEEKLAEADIRSNN